MELHLSKIRWIRVCVSSFLIIVLAFVAVTIITAGYAFVLAFEAHGKPDQAAISQFAATISRRMMPIFEVLFTCIVAFVSTKKTLDNISLHGFLMGIIAGVLSTLVKIGFGSQITFRTYVLFIIIAGSGFIGGFFNQRLFSKNVKSSDGIKKIDKIDGQ